MTNSLTFEEQNVLLHVGAQALADRIGTTRENAYEQMRQYMEDGKLVFHGDAAHAYLSAAGHELVHAERPLLRIAATPANDFRILEAFTDWLYSMPTDCNDNDMNIEAESRVNQLLDELDKGDELDRRQAAMVRELKAPIDRGRNAARGPLLKRQEER
jgi:hypothetical protein